MALAELYFATNRNHQGGSRWYPNSYGKKFSSDGHENLRFGRLELEYDENKANDCINHVFEDGRVGNGEALELALGQENASILKIEAYEDHTSSAVEPIDFDTNSSTRFFRNIKGIMMNNVDIVIFIHGYNIDWHEAVASALSLQFMLNSKRGPEDREVRVVLFSWPSNGSMMPYAAYKSDRVDARDSAKAIGRAFLKLENFLERVSLKASRNEEELCGGNIHLLCHSMGNYVLQHAIVSKLIGYSGAGDLPRIFDHIFLCAPDVKDDALEKGGLVRLPEMCNNITVYYNRGDIGMNLSKFTKHFQDRLGHTGNAHPALVHNKVHQVNCSPIVKGLKEHSYYQWATVNQDIQQSIAGVLFDDESRKRKREAQSREWSMI